MIRSMTALVVAAAVMLALTSKSAAEVLVFEFTLDGLQETPPNASPGSGSAFVTLNTETLLLDWHVMYAGLTTGVTAAHFHSAPIGVAGPVIVNIGPSGPLGNTSGMFMGNATVTALQAQEIINGLWYINIHTSTFPGGEIRGQVVPTPGALALLGLAGLMARRRRA